MKKTKQSRSRLLAVDPSLRSTGWVLLELSEDRLLEIGSISSPGPPRSLASRLAALQSRIDSLLTRLDLGPTDYLVCEGPAPIILNPHTALKVEHVRGIFETLARHRTVTVPGRINPRSVHVEVLGIRGHQLERARVKDIARQTALRLFREQLSSFFSTADEVDGASQDILDALLIGFLSSSRIKRASALNTDVIGLFESSSHRRKRSKRSTADRNAWELLASGRKPARR